MAVNCTKDGHVAIVSFSRPPHNFADLALIETIGAAFDALDADRDIRAIVLRSEGRVFCAGADLVRANPVAEERPAGERNPFYVAAAKLFGVTKPVVAAVLERIVGKQRALTMLLTGRRIGGGQAHEWGLVDQLVAPSALDEAALALAREIATGAPLAVRSTRATLRGDLARLVAEATDHELAEQAWLQKTGDFAEGVRAVNERRPGRFTGE